jgi:hypothetical protein
MAKPEVNPFVSKPETKPACSTNSYVSLSISTASQNLLTFFPVPSIDCQFDTVDTSKLSNLSMWFLSSVLQSRQECIQIWNNIHSYQTRYLDDTKNNKEDLLSFLLTDSHRYLFEVLMQQCGWYDSRLYSDSVLQYYNCLVYGGGVGRKNATSYFLGILDQVRDESDQVSRTELQYCVQQDLSLDRAADIILTILNQHIVQLAKRSHTCFLVQRLFKAASLKKRCQIIELLLPNILSLSQHERGNYFVTCIMKFLQNARAKKTDGDMNQQFVTYWWELSRILMSNIDDVEQLAQNKYEHLF